MNTILHFQVSRRVAYFQGIIAVQALSRERGTGCQQAIGLSSTGGVTCGTKKPPGGARG
jgi:hypothetical protein